MSTVNTETLTLYAHPKLYNGSRYVFNHDGREYVQWLDDTSESKKTVTVYYKSLSEPLELKMRLADAINYTYATLTNDGKLFFLFIDSITTDQCGKSFVSYTVDWWQSQWDSLTPTIAHVTRSSIKPGYMAQPYRAFYYNVDERYPVTEKYSIMATYIPSDGDEEGVYTPSYISYLIMEGTDKNLKMVEQGYWYQELGIPGSDIKDCFIVPFFSLDEMSDMVFDSLVESDDLSEAAGEMWYTFDEMPESGVPLEDLIEDNDEVFSPLEAFSEMYPYFEGKEHDYSFWPEHGQYIYDPANDTYYRFAKVYVRLSDLSTTAYFRFNGYVKLDYDPTHGYAFVRIWKRLEGNDDDLSIVQTTMSKGDEEYPLLTMRLEQPFESSEKFIEGMQDWNGNSIWSCPYPLDVEGFDIRLYMGISHILLKFIPFGGSDGDSMTGMAFTYDCRHPGLFVDSYTDYILKSKDYDIAMRDIQSQKQFVAAAFSTIENIGFGYAFGDKPGAKAAGIGGLVETIGVGLTNAKYDPLIQEQYDLRYAKMTDQISLVGDTVTPLFYSKPMYFYRLTMDEASSDRMDMEIATNGYRCDELVTNLSERFVTGDVLQADSVTIEGAACLESKRQMANRLSEGVEFI